MYLDCDCAKLNTIATAALYYNKSQKKKNISVAFELENIKQYRNRVYRIAQARNVYKLNV